MSTGQSESLSRRTQPRKRHRIAWTAISTFIVLAALATYAAVHQGVRQVNFKQDTISFQGVSRTVIVEQQPAIKAALSNAQASAQEQAAPAPSVANIAGYWSGAYGRTYFIQQYGNQAVMQEETSYGITAVAEGTVGNDWAKFNFQAVDGSTGQVYLSVQSSTTMVAQFDNNTYNTSGDATLTRE